MHDDEQQQQQLYPPYSSYHTLAYHKSSSAPHPIALSVSTSTTSEHDPNESTARPGNAHKHAQFLGRPYPLDDLPALDDPGVTPIVTRPPSTAGLSRPLPALHDALPDSAHHHQQQQQQQQQPPSPPKNPPAPSSSSSSSSSTTTTTTTSTSTTSTTDYTLNNTPGISRGLTRPLTPEEQEKLTYLDRLKFFLATAPSQWDNVRSNQSFAPTQHANAYPSTSSSSHGLTSVGSSTGWGMGLPPVGATGPGPGDYGHGIHPSLNRFMLPSQEFVTCVLWNGLYHITGTDIVRALVFRFEAFGRPVRNMKKFEEGVFSDLRNLKPGVDACLEEPKSPFLDLLFKYQCIRTQKKQKVFYWFSVPHDRLFLDALERDLKREKMGLEPTTQVVGEPALSFSYDPKRSLYEQFAKAQGVKEGEGDLENAFRRADSQEAADGVASGDSSSDAELADGTSKMGNLQLDSASAAEDSEMSDADELTLTEEEREKKRRFKQELQRKKHLQKIANANGNGAAFFSNLFLFEGSPTYKQRRKKNAAGGGSTLSRSMSNSSGGSSGAIRGGSEEIDERGRPRSIGSFPDRHHHHHHHSHSHSHSTSVSRERSYPYPQPHPHPQYQPHHHHTYPGARPFPFPSMVDEFGPGSLDYRERAEPNAAQLFHKQARGELVPADGVVRKPRVAHVTPDVGVLISEGYSAHRIQQQGHPQQQYGAAPPMDTPPYTAGEHHPGFAAGYVAQPVDSSSSSPGHSAVAPYETLTPDGKFRAFMCPLYSCGRLFKRMEHLKRHLRTHTMERPFMCPICQKRFSRSDNLNQHVRTHERSANAANSNGNTSTTTAAAAAVVGGGSVTNADFGSAATPGIIATGTTNMDMDTPGGISFNAGMNMGMWRDTGSNEESDLSGAESEGFDDDGFAFGAHRGMYAFPNPQQNQMSDQMIDMFGMGGVFDQMGPAGVFANAGDMDAQMQMCAVEVQPGDVSEIPGGEEEGLVLRSGVRGQIPQGHHQYAGHLFSQYPNPAAAADYAESQWNARPQPVPSPAFSNMSVPSPPPGGLAHSLGSNRSSLGSPPPGSAGFMPAPHTSSSTSTTTPVPIYGNRPSNPDDFVVTSLSAPSHIQAFDHAALYTSAGLSESPGTGGPVRRQKSATPSLLRNGEQIRRPMTASSNGSGDYAMPGQSGGSPGSGNTSSGNGYSNGGMMGMNMNMNMGAMKMAIGANVNMNMGARGYHPYASGYATSSRPSSTHSSPAVYPVGLPEGGHQPGLRRSDSRASLLGGAVMQEQMQRHMLGLDADHQQAQASGGDVAGASMFRTDSPAAFPQTESPAPYTIDLPQMYGHASGVAVGAYDIQQEQQFYSHP